MFFQINDRINEEMAAHPEYADMMLRSKKNIPYSEFFGLCNVMEKTVLKVFILLRQNNWMHRNLIFWNFNMTNVSFSKFS
jgi:amidophosphoribosyltransferase